MQKLGETIVNMVLWFTDTLNIEFTKALLHNFSEEDAKTISKGK